MSLIDPEAATRARFWAKVDTSGDCWIWLAEKNQSGYGRIRIAGKKLTATRVVYEWANGPIPAGMQLDHLCRTRACVRPDHLEPVTPRENTMRSPIAVGAVYARRTHCNQGHEFTPENTRYQHNSGGRRRVCATCASIKDAKYRARLRERRAS